MKCGQILLVDYPFKDESGSKVRPTLVVSADEHNKGDEIVVVPISSVPDANDPDTVYIAADSPAFKATGLRQASSIKWTKPLTISRRVVRRRLGRLASELLAEVHARLREMFRQ